MTKIKRAVISVSNKASVVELAQALESFGVEILSTGGTAKSLRQAGITVKDVSEHTGFPEMLDGRVKTLHPKIHGGLLARRALDKDMQEIQAHGIGLIDMVVVNLYPFEETVSKEGAAFEDIIENIDIGGPTMLRSASKNFTDVAVVVDPKDYEHIIDEMRNLGGGLSYKTKAKLAAKVFAHTSRYDSLIADYFRGITDGDEFPEELTFGYKLASPLRYGENPHQRAAAYSERGGLNIFEARKIQGKEMSFNNFYDAHSALLLALEFDRPACAIVKHTNPCGAGVGRNPLDAYIKAARTDPVSAFGGVIAFNTPVDGETAAEITKIFVEVVIATGFTYEALATFAIRPEVRLLELPDIRRPLKGWDVKRIPGGVLVQEWDSAQEDIPTLKAITKRQPTSEEREALSFAWKVCKHVKSNAIVYSVKDRTVGIGIGQTSRVFSARAGAINALEPLSGSVAASDGFFPFRDGIDALNHVGVRAVIQPGGSLRDEEVVKAADEHDMAMILTGVRHFKH